MRFFKQEGWGFVVERQSSIGFRQPSPVTIENYVSESQITRQAFAYDAVEQHGEVITAHARLSLGQTARCVVNDEWSLNNHDLRLRRRVTVEGQADGGFLTALCLNVDIPLKWSEIDAFAPGMIYGRAGRLNPRAIGSQENYVDGVRHFVLREDRLPAPVFGIQLPDHSSITILNAAPDARTIAEEGMNLEPATRVDSRLRFGALGAVEQGDTLTLGYWFPGTEGEVTYRGREFPFGQLRKWRRAYHPIENGLVQEYEIVLHFGVAPTFADCCRDTWRWAWTVLAPNVYVQDIEMVRQFSVQVLYDMMHRARNGKIGVYLYADISPHAKGAVHYRFEHVSEMGFTGRGPDAGYYLLREALRPDTPEDKRQQFRERGKETLDSYTSISMDPPEAQGFNLFDGALHTSKFVEAVADTLYLRTLCEGAKFVLKAWQTQQQVGDNHPRWLEWGQQIADFLLSKQLPAGGVPRIFVARTGEVYKESPRSTYNVIPLWILMFQITGEQRYLDAALRAGDFCWSDGHQDFCFVGGTIDNPDVIDKEAGTLSLEAYLALYEQTHDEKWLAYAKQAADYCETWIYCWNVPMPEDADEVLLHWKKGVPTIGLQLIATGHSLVDDYMAFDVASYAKMYRYTGDKHYLDIAMILLHNTKIMTSLPDHPYDLPQYGWQQEHWGIAPSRGIGMHRGWLAWVTCSNLQGILELEDFDRELYRQMCVPTT